MNWCTSINNSEIVSILLYFSYNNFGYIYGRKAMVQGNLTITMDDDGENKTQHAMTEGNTILMNNNNMISMSNNTSN
jgi:hypothetical protein